MPSAGLAASTAARMLSRSRVKCLAVLDFDRADAGDALEALRAGKLRHPFAKLGKRRDIEVRLWRPGRPFLREAGEPVVHIGRVADLAGLAIADDVDADLGLPLDDIEHRLPDCPVEFRGVVGGPAFARLEQPHHRLGARQAADMGGENPLLAGFHVCSLLRLNLMADPPLARMQQRVDRDRKQKQQQRQREDIDDVVAFRRPDQGVADAGR